MVAVAAAVAVGADFDDSLLAAATAKSVLSSSSFRLLTLVALADKKNQLRQREGHWLPLQIFLNSCLKIKELLILHKSLYVYLLLYVSSA